MSERNGGWRFTCHARERMEQMRLDRTDVVEVLRRPMIDRPAPDRSRHGKLYPTGCRLQQGECADGRRIGIVTAGERVITVLWWQDDEYVRSTAS
jgi:hypothetical protein